MGTKEASFLLGMSRQRLLVLLAQGRVKGAEKKGRFWEIPAFENGMPVIIPARRGPKGMWRKKETTTPKMIHVNQHKIKSNKGKPPAELEAVVSLKHGNNNYYGYELYISGPCQIVYRPYKPASCGAHLWINTFDSVQFIDTKSNPATARQSSKQIYA
ncbi:hypothetical protein [Okeania sp. KiyG1]|uniref:hypothetical protein n=1 Tax=Okeania sp. KiyG1 TaxID=2720165 RepID=UPI0019244859|nr:hypothetical protein [Okeania sp. KiyG1]GFZ94964.1 hypothetical protein CYANOKiyG1_05980 [Okeania sp. KiyG1]